MSIWAVLRSVGPTGGVKMDGTVAFLATMRGRRRRAFVASVYRDEHPNYRVEDTSDGKVLVRVESHGDGYRVAEVDEALVELDQDGAARRVLTGAP